jgi:hypothetical protein
MAPPVEANLKHQSGKARVAKAYRYKPFRERVMAQNNTSSFVDVWGEAPEVFPSRKAVAAFISERFSRSQRSVLRDLATEVKGEKRTPKCFPRNDGQGYDLLEVQRYAKAEGLELREEWGGGDMPDAGDMEGLRKFKLAQESRKIQAQAERDELKLAQERGELVPRESRDQMLAQRIRLLKQGLRIELRNAASDLLHAANGDPSLLPRFKQQCVELADQIMAKWYHAGGIEDGTDHSGIERDQTEDSE